MTTFVLVHGAMHGAWCWRPVQRLLAARGHLVVTPTLTGQGDRRHLLTPEVGIATHVDDILEALWFEDVADAHLVCHSYAGVLAGPVAERAGERLASVVFLGAFLTEPGQSLLDVEPPEVARRYRDQVAANDGWRLPATTAFLDQWGITDPGLRAWIGPRLTDFPFRCQVEPTEYDPGPLAKLPKCYVRHTAPELASLGRFFDQATAAGWRTADLACGHDMMLAAPEATADLLVQLTTEPAL